MPQGSGAQRSNWLPGPGLPSDVEQLGVLEWSQWLSWLTGVVDEPGDGTGGQLRTRVLDGLLTLVGPARWVSLSRRPLASDGPERLATVMASDPVAADADAVQHALGQGPSLQTLADGAVIVVDRLDADVRWPSLATHISRSSVVRSAMSVPLPTGGSAGAVLTLYSDRPVAFVGDAVSAAVVATAGAGLALAGIEQRIEADGLRRALLCSRQIGAAIGILMGRHKCTEEQAFTALRQASQHTHRKLREIAEDVLLTGALPGQDMR